MPQSQPGFRGLKASKDVYNFSVPAGGKSLFLGFTGCLSQHPNPYISYLKWRVINRTTAAEVTSGQCYNGGKQINNLPAGDYALELTTEQDNYGTPT